MILEKILMRFTRAAGELDASLPAGYQALVVPVSESELRQLVSGAALNTQHGTAWEELRRRAGMLGVPHGLKAAIKAQRDNG